jgi:DNA-binding CsgD family transcriptional regulator
MSDLARLQEGLWQDADEAPDLESFRRAMLQRLAAVIGYGSGIAVPLPLRMSRDDVPTAVAGIHYDPVLFQLFIENRVRYGASLGRFFEAAAQRKMAISTDVYSRSEIGRLDLCAEILLPTKTTSTLSAFVTFRGFTTCCISLNRHQGTRNFGRGDLDHLQPLLPLMGLADAAVSARRRSQRVDTAKSPTGGTAATVVALTAREREIASLIRLGLQNKEIAAALGTSVDTVRKQTIRIYQKLRVSGRVEAALRFAEIVGDESSGG